MTNNDIEYKQSQIFGPGRRYGKAERYYDGEHDLAFATEKFQNTFGTLFREFALNLCPVICDAVRDKMRIVGFSVEDGAAVSSSPHVSKGPRQPSDWPSITVGLRTRRPPPRGDLAA